MEKFKEMISKRIRQFLADNDHPTDETDVQKLIEFIESINKGFLDEWYTDLDADYYMASGKGFKETFKSEFFAENWEDEGWKNLDDDTVYIEDCGVEPIRYIAVGKMPR